MNCAHAQEQVVDMLWRLVLARSIGRLAVNDSQKAKEHCEKALSERYVAIESSKHDFTLALENYSSHLVNVARQQIIYRKLAS